MTKRFGKLPYEDKEWRKTKHDKTTPQAEKGYGWNLLNHYRCGQNNYILFQQIPNTSIRAHSPGIPKEEISRELYSDFWYRKQ